ncbi:MAG TPA: hypothetical protein VGP80_13730 [Gemmatimonadales bacterium]|nr:hypothetical protein [Gemmatimonadales bacterium]
MSRIGYRLGLLLFPFALGVAPLQAQGSPAWSRCTMDSLSTWNCAQYYSGTVSYNAELKGQDLHQVRSIVATITAGRVTCKVKEPDAPEFEGPGMLAVEHESNMNAGKYKISVWCPEAAGERPTRRDDPMIESYEQQAADYATLNGKDAHEHPDADAANGLTGTETITWALKRS